MTENSGPTLADDEAALAQYAQQLIDAVEAVVGSWMTTLVIDRAPQLAADPEVVAQLDQAATQTVVDLRALLELDIVDQPSGPLEVLRRAVAVPNQLLAATEVAPGARDEFARTNFPDDIYNLTPASFADVDASLHEPGLMWGAAKAHVHLRRRREPPRAPRVVALSVDLMDRSKISAAFADATMVRSVAKLLDVAADADIVVVDLARLGDPTELSPIAGRVVGFGSHVDQAVLDAAKAAGIEALARSVFFRRLETGDL